MTRTKNIRRKAYTETNKVDVHSEKIVQCDKDTGKEIKVWDKISDAEHRSTIARVLREDSSQVVTKTVKLPEYLCCNSY